MKFNPPPNWPQPPADWQPPKGWTPDPKWGPAPEGWRLWIDDDQAAPPPVKKSWVARHKVLTGLGIGLLVIIGIANLPGGSGTPTAAPEPPAETAAVGPADADQATDAGDTADSGTGEDSSTTVEQAADPEPSKEAENTDGAAPEADLPGIGDAVAAGSMEYTVEGIECGETELGDEFLSIEAQGQFCLLQLSITTIGDSAESVTSYDQLAYDAGGREFSSDAEAGFYVDDNDIWLEEINPGNTLQGVLVFDVGKDTTLTRVALSPNAWFSEVAEISLN